ncbi:sensor histidine kinase, partial [Mediterraneibacter faecis]|uniref:sensor histidine kinase n=1 Tax=Mediterraneibacter faecis TaxID=592978 RepID=UPI002ED116E5|nr:Signal transduction histidine kinase [Mediterraneibacter faecis]
QSKEIQYSIDTNIQHNYAVCDKTKLQVLYLNIVSYAIKYTPNGQAIHVNITETASDDKKAWYLFICEDTGIVMKQEYIPHIF